MARRPCARWRLRFCFTSITCQKNPIEVYRHACSVWFATSLDKLELIIQSYRWSCSMSDSVDHTSSKQFDFQPPPIPEPPPQPRFFTFAFGLGFLAWCVIIGLVIFVVASDRGTEEKIGAQASKDNLNLLSMRMQARYLIGTRDLARYSKGGDEQQIVEQARKLNT